MAKMYRETWATNDDKEFLDIWFTEYEMKQMPYAYRLAKRNVLAEEHRFDIKHAGKIREEEIDLDKLMDEHNI